MAQPGTSWRWRWTRRTRPERRRPAVCSAARPKRSERFDEGLARCPPLTTPSARRRGARVRPRDCPSRAGARAQPRPAREADKAPTAGLLRPAAQARAEQRGGRGRLPAHPRTKLVGTAKTLRFVPNREDLFKSHGGGYNAQKRASTPWARRGDRDRGARGDRSRDPRGRPRAAGPPQAVLPAWSTDGGVRDYVVQVDRAALFCRAPTRRRSAGGTCRGESDVAVACGTSTVLPGDVVGGGRRRRWSRSRGGARRGGGAGTPWPRSTRNVGRPSAWPRATRWTGWPRPASGTEVQQWLVENPLPSE
ncbi:hypothetical protein QJS66_13045 [Kocuria rhizophila]|nr:hypothetical protein QJS66_13045 [Kocuria rhizophila]